jgi:hypothetical protein
MMITKYDYAMYNDVLLMETVIIENRLNYSI